MNKLFIVTLIAVICAISTTESRTRFRRQYGSPYQPMFPNFPQPNWNPMQQVQGYNPEMPFIPNTNQGLTSKNDNGNFEGNYNSGMSCSYGFDGKKSVRKCQTSNSG